MENRKNPRLEHVLPCPTCGAEAEVGCRKDSGELTKAGVHRARADAVFEDSDRAMQLFQELKTKAKRDPIQKIVLRDGTVRWRFREYRGRRLVKDPQRPDGKKWKQIIVTGTYDTKREAKAAWEKVIGREKGNPSRELLGPYLERFLLNVKKKSLRPRTFSDYMGVLRRYVLEPPPGAPKLGEIRLRDLTVHDIDELYTFLEEKEGLSPQTIRSLHAVLRQGLQRAQKVGDVTENVAALVDLPPLKSKEVVYMTTEESKRFLQEAKKDRYHALWLVLLTGGLRPGEALGLLWDDVDLDGATVQIQKALTRRGVDRDEHPEGWALAPPKTTEAVRPVVLPKVTIRALRDWRASQAREQLQLGAEYRNHGFVFTNEFGSPLDGANLYSRNYRRICERAGLGQWTGEGKRRRFKPTYRLYSLRHTCATQLIHEAKLDAKVVSERLGHKSVSFTQDVYVGKDPKRQKEAAEAMDALHGSSG